MFFNHGGCLLFNLFKTLPQLIQIFLYDLNQLARPCLNHTLLISHFLYHHGTLRTLLWKDLPNFFHSRKHLIHRPILNGNIFIYHFHTHTMCPHTQLNIHRSNTFKHFLCCFAQILLILLDCAQILCPQSCCRFRHASAGGLPQSLLLLDASRWLRTTSPRLSRSYSCSNRKPLFSL